jgi:hypothetical protein
VKNGSIRHVEFVGFAIQNVDAANASFSGVGNAICSILNNIRNAVMIANDFLVNAFLTKNPS